MRGPATGSSFKRFLKDQPAVTSFSHVDNGQIVAANDGGWTLASAGVSDIELYRVNEGGLTKGGRNGIVRYNSGDGWFAIPENNWATSLTPGHGTASYNEKLLGLNIRNAGAIGLINLIYNLARCEQIVRLKLLPRNAA